MENKMTCIVIGAGAAGIAAVTSLVDENIFDILWIDPEFKGGVLNSYRNIPANTLIVHLNKMFKNSKNFNRSKYLAPYDNLDIYKTHNLSHTHDSLMLLSQDLQSQVNCINGKVVHLSKMNENYSATVLTNSNEEIKIETKFVIICSGGIERTLGEASPHIKYGFPNIKQIDLISSLDSLNSPSLYEDGDIVAVVGSSHSGILAVMNIIESGKNVQVHLFTKNGIKFATLIEYRMFVHNANGLKGRVALWCKENIVSNPHPNISMHYVTRADEELLYNTHLQTCNKIIYALGFVPHISMEITCRDDIVNVKEYDYAKNRILFTNPTFDGVFGLGMVFPMKYKDLSGDTEYLISIANNFENSNKIVSQIKSKLENDRV